MLDGGQIPDPTSGSKGLGGILGLVAFFAVLGILAWRKRRASAGVTVEEARRELARLQREGVRDVSTEIHIRTCLSWCTAYAVLSLLAFGVSGFVASKSPDAELRRPIDRSTGRFFAAVMALEVIGLWVAGRGLARGREGSHWLASGLLTSLSLTAAATGILHLSRPAQDAPLTNVVLHAAVAVYAVAGATFLLLPRSARLCTPAYRDAVGGVESAETRAALNLARVGSPFSWVPVGLLVAAALLSAVLKK
jgi:hypothetical protein